MVISWWLWGQSTRSTKISGVLTSTLVTLLEQPKITVSLVVKRPVIPKSFVSARKNGLDLQMVHIYFDTPTFDRVERDVKVTNSFSNSLLHCPFLDRLPWLPSWVLLEAQWDSSPASRSSVASRLSTLLLSSSSGKWRNMRAKYQ